jgi:hypothetical protein
MGRRNTEKGKRRCNRTSFDRMDCKNDGENMLIIADHSCRISANFPKSKLN